jgi:curved DNA-binding protein
LYGQKISFMAFVDYYKILGLGKDATAEEIKKAYRKLARKYHPDLNPNDKVAEQKFKELNEANEVLGNPENRKKYDQYGSDWKHADEINQAKQQQQQGYSRASSSRSDFSESDYSDFFESMFGGGNERRRAGGNAQFRGQNFHSEMTLHIKDILQSQKQILSINGKKVNITIPAGIEDEQVLKLKNFGGAGVNGGPNGDLYVKFNIVNDTPFKRDKNDLYTTVPLDLYTAILGGEIIADTFDGKVKLKINPETQNDTKVKLKGKGLPLFNKEGQLGDLYISFQITLPTKLSDKEKELFTTLQNLRKI